MNRVTQTMNGGTALCQSDQTNTVFCLNGMPRPDLVVHQNLTNETGATNHTLLLNDAPLPDWAAIFTQTNAAQKFNSTMLYKGMLTPCPDLVLNLTNARAGFTLNYTTNHAAEGPPIMLFGNLATTRGFQEDDSPDATLTLTTTANAGNMVFDAIRTDQLLLPVPDLISSTTAMRTNQGLLVTCEQSDQPLYQSDQPDAPFDSSGAYSLILMNDGSYGNFGKQYGVHQSGNLADWQLAGGANYNLDGNQQDLANDPGGSSSGGGYQFGEDSGGNGVAWSHQIMDNNGNGLGEFGNSAG